MPGYSVANGLPTWDEAAFEPLLARLSTPDRQGVEYYLRSLPTEKVLALGPSGGVYWREGRWSLHDARDGVLAYCHEETGGNCQLVAEDFHPLPLAAEKEGTSRPSD